jgi:hypothetical protein
MRRGGLNLKNQGFATPFTIHDHPAMGLKTNPAHLTTPARFGGLEAAYPSAMGVENDSAKSTKGPALGTASLTNGSSSACERNFCVGYVITVVVNVSGSAARKSANNCPVPSKPGRSTNCLRAKSFTTNP